MIITAFAIGTVIRATLLCGRRGWTLRRAGGIGFKSTVLGEDIYGSVPGRLGFAWLPAWLESRPRGSGG